MKVIVRTPHHESDLQAVPKTSTREIFQTMCKSLGIQETWWFGLMYKGPDNEDVWIDKSKKVSPFCLTQKWMFSQILIMLFALHVFIYIFYPLCMNRHLKRGEFGSSRLNFETFKIFMQPFSIGLDFFCGWAFFCNCHGFFFTPEICFVVMNIQTFLSTNSVILGYVNLTEYLIMNSYLVF